MTDPTPDARELDALLGAYAIDAIDADERARVEAYLLHDADARAEVDEMRETAASLALLPDTPIEAPPGLWARIEEAIAAEAQAGPEAPASPPDDLGARREARTRSGGRWTVPVAAAAAVAIVLLSLQVVHLRRQIDRGPQVGAQATAAAFDRAANAPGAREVGLESASGATLARVVLLPDGRGFLRGDQLRKLSPSRTYQLWALTGNGPTPNVVSAGVLGPHPEAVAFSASGPVHGFAVTIESAGGVVTSHHKPVAAAQLS